MPGLHAQELHRPWRFMAAETALPASLAARAAPTPSDVDRARARRRCPRRPSRTASRGDRACAARAASSGSGRARGAPRAPRSGCSPSRARRRRGGARRGSRPARSPSKKRSVASLAVAAGDDDRAGPERVDRAGELLGVGVLAASPASTRASGRFGVTTVARGSDPLDAARLARLASSSTAPLSATITGSSTTGASPSRSSASVDRRDRLARAEHADLHRVDADVVGDRADLRDDHLRRDRRRRRRRRRCSAR